MQRIPTDMNAATSCAPICFDEHTLKAVRLVRDSHDRKEKAEIYVVCSNNFIYSGHSQQPCEQLALPQIISDHIIKQHIAENIVFIYII